MRSAVRIEAVDRRRIEFGQGTVQGASCGSEPGRGPRGKIVNLPDLRTKLRLRPSIDGIQVELS